jgi:arylsulfatase A-like enzyme
VPSRPPNVVLIVSDDHGYGDLSSLGHDPEVRTPHLDRLAASGVTCTQGYVAAPICSPSRAALMSGRNPLSFGTTWFSDSHLPEDGATLAERFRELGYATGYLGKVHYGPEGPGDRACPPQHGFDESFYGLAGQSMGRLHYLKHSEEEVARRGPEATKAMAVAPLYEGEDETELDGFMTWEIGGRARDFVSRHAEQPFFLNVAFNAVHNFCWQLPDEELDKRGLPGFEDWDPELSEYLDWYDGAISPNLPDGRAYYRAQLELMDAEIGRLLDRLDELGLAENTVVVYLTDNGGSTCNYGDNTPLRGTKYTLYEGGVRVPFMVSWPGGELPAGSERDGLISAVDLYATLLAAAGAPASSWAETDSLDQLPMLRGQQAEGHSALHWDNGFQWAVRTPEWKLLHVDPDSPTAEAIRQVEHTEPGRGTHLYRITEDISESDDLAGRRPEVVAELTALHQQWRSVTTGSGAGT